MRIIVGSKNRVKILACQLAFEKIKKKHPSQFKNNISIDGISAKSGVPEMPLTLNALLNGARNRALAVYNSLTQKPDFTIGMEGGVFPTSDFEATSTNNILQSWVYIFNGEKGYYGCSAGIPVSKDISHALFVEGKELAGVIDNISGKENVRSNEGACGVLSNNLFTRSDAFESAIINAAIPFFNTYIYTSL